MADFDAEYGKYWRLVVSGGCLPNATFRCFGFALLSILLFDSDDELVDVALRMLPLLISDDGEPDCNGTARGKLLY